jgi:FkbM family methyltransferase
VRKLLNKWLRPAGYRIERISPFQRELEALARQPQGFKFVQIGAHDGVRFDDLYRFVTNHLCSGIVVEPLPDAFERLRANYADYPRILPINKAIHASAPALALYRVSPGALTRYAGWASGIASFQPQHLLGLGIAPADVSSVTVPCTPLMQLLEESSMLDADLLQIDTEGYDAAILRMIDPARFRPRLIKYEHKSLSAGERAEAQAGLEKHGYRIAREGPDTIAWLAGDQG